VNVEGEDTIREFEEAELARKRRVDPDVKTDRGNDNVTGKPVTLLTRALKIVGMFCIGEKVPSGNAIAQVIATIHKVPTGCRGKFTTHEEPP
jgi:hypothetical protein